MRNTSDTSDETTSGGGGGAALIYCRVSGPGQERDGASLETQEAACRALAARLGYTVARVTHEVYRGSELFDRPQLTRDRADLRAGRFAALIVHTTSRLARNPIHQAIIIEEAMRGGARVEMVEEPLDTSPEGMLIAYVRGYAAQIDRERIREQTMRGRRARVERGQLANAGMELYGYRRDREAGVRQIDETAAAVVRRIYHLCVVEHRGTKTIARLLDAEGVPTPGTGKRSQPPEAQGRAARWSSSMVRNILRNPAYRGETLVWRYRSTLAPARPTRRTQYQTTARPPEEAVRLPDGVTPAIVSAETWYAAQLALSSRIAQRTAQHTSATYLLRGLITCGVCGRHMEARTIVVWRPTGATRRVYRCASHQTLERSCGGSRIRADDIEAWAWSEVRALLHDPALLAREAQASQARLDQAQTDADTLTLDQARLTAALARVERLQARTLARYNTVDDEAVLPWALVQAELTRLDADRARYARQLADVEAAIATRSTVTRWQATLHEQIAALAVGIDQRTSEQRRALLESMRTRLVGNGETWQMVLELLPGDEATIVVRAHPAPPATPSVQDVLH